MEDHGPESPANCAATWSAFHKDGPHKFVFTVGNPVLETTTGGTGVLGTTTACCLGGGGAAVAAAAAFLALLHPHISNTIAYNWICVNEVWFGGVSTNTRQCKNIIAALEDRFPVSRIRQPPI